MKSEISSSMMCADIYDMEHIIRTFEENEIEYLHVDIMDGKFVPNFTLGPDYCRMLKKHCRIPLDLHFMVEEPENKLGWFDIGAGDYVSVHAESTYHLQRVLNQIRTLGAKAMVAMNPATPIYVLEDVLDDIDAVLVMTVNPGFSGQKLVPQTLDKIKRLRSFLDEKNHAEIKIEVDGNVSFENAAHMKEAGANMFVAGTSSIFCKNFDINTGIKKLREILM